MPPPDQRRRDRRAARCARDPPASRPPTAWTSSPCAVRADGVSSRRPPVAPGRARGRRPSVRRRRPAPPRRDTPAPRPSSTWRCVRAGRCGRTTAPSRGTGEVQDAARRPLRIGGPALDGKACGGGEAVQRLGVGGGGGEEPGEVGKRRAAEFDLAAGLHGDLGATGQRIGGGRRVEGDRGVCAQRGGECGGREVLGGAGPHQPLQLHTGEPRRPVLEADGRDVRLGRRPITQHSHLAALLRWIRRGGSGTGVRGHAQRRYPRAAGFARVFGVPPGPRHAALRSRRAPRQHRPARGATAADPGRRARLLRRLRLRRRHRSQARAGHRAVPWRDLPPLRRQGDALPRARRAGRPADGRRRRRAGPRAGHAQPAGRPERGAQLARARAWRRRAACAPTRRSASASGPTPRS